MMDSLDRQVTEVFHAEASRVLATLYGSLRDFERAEDALQDALVAALECWPDDGIPTNPGAWMTTVARRKAIDRLRREAVLERKTALLQNLHTLDTGETPAADVVPDERLKLIFTCCHPALAQDAQIALTLHTLGGLSTAEIAHAFLVPVPTIAQRLVRTKRKIRDAAIPYHVPAATALSERLDAVRTTLYLIFNAGYTAPSGEHLIRADLCGEAIRLARMLLELESHDPPIGTHAESYGLLALMVLHHARREARHQPDGALVLLEDQDRALWKAAEIAEGSALLDHALLLGAPGPYQVQAAISALHALAPCAAATDWLQIAALYGVLARMVPSPVIELNRAVAVAMAGDLAAGLAMMDHLITVPALEHYYLLYAARADLLARSGQTTAASAAYERALALCHNQVERAFLARRLAQL